MCTACVQRQTTDRSTIQFLMSLISVPLLAPMCNSCLLQLSVFITHSCPHMLPNPSRISLLTRIPISNIYDPNPSASTYSFFLALLPFASSLAAAFLAAIFLSSVSTMSAMRGQHSSPLHTHKQVRENQPLHKSSPAYAS